MKRIFLFNYHSRIMKTKEQKRHHQIMDFLCPVKGDTCSSFVIQCVNNVFYWLHLTGCSLKRERCVAKLRTAELLNVPIHVINQNSGFLCNIRFTRGSSAVIRAVKAWTRSDSWHIRNLCNPSLSNWWVWRCLAHPDFKRHRMTTKRGETTPKRLQEDIKWS